MPFLRLLLLPTCAALLAEAVLAQGRPAPNRRAEPPPACLVSEFRAMALGTHDLAERGKKAAEWLQRNLPGCGEDQLRLLSSNRTLWMGNADSLQLMSTIDSALETRLKGKPEQVVRMFGAAPPPPRPAGDDTVRSGTLAPPRPPVVAPGTPAAVTLAQPPVVVAGAVAGMPPGAVPGMPPGAVPGMPPGAVPGMPAGVSPALPPGTGTPRPPEVGRHFDARLRAAVRDFFTANRGSGPCPPGTILKNARCESPLSTRPWKPGQPLPPQLNLREAPVQLLEQLGPPPPGHSYVQLEGDLLLINTATQVVVDAVLDLGQVPPRN